MGSFHDRIISWDKMSFPGYDSMVWGAWLSVAIKLSEDRKFMTKSRNLIGDVLQVYVENVCGMCQRNRESVEPSVPAFILKTDEGNR